MVRVEMQAKVTEAGIQLALAQGARDTALEKNRSTRVANGATQWRATTAAEDAGRRITKVIEARKRYYGLLLHSA